MASRIYAIVALLLLGSGTVVEAVEGSTAAGPIGGTDIRSAQLPPPGLYVGGATFYGDAWNYYDGNGKAVPALRALELHRTRVGAFALFVPQQQVFGGSIGLLGVVSGGRECGRALEAAPSRCITGGGDPYVEIAWSRFFGKLRPSTFPGAFPVAEGLTTQVGVGAVIPSGQYAADVATRQGLVIGNNIWDFSGTAAITYITAPIIADGTELSVKGYWNNYLSNSDTKFATGDLLNFDFALTEKFGRLQAGLAGFYAFQVGDDRVGGVRIPPDGHRGAVLNLGGVVAYDVPELASALKLKVLTTALTENTVRSWGAVFTFVHKIQ